jgi:hypothetical protein
MTTALETISTIIILILVVLLLQHAVEGSAWKWITSKFKTAGA